MIFVEYKIFNSMKYFFVVVISVVSIVSAQKKITIDNKLRLYKGMQSEQLFSIFNKLENIPEYSNISIALVQKDTTIFYGVYKENNSLITIPNKNTVYEIGSLTKVFTSNLLAQMLVDQKIQRLKEPINKYYKRSFANHEAISFLSLANHTSGLPALPSNLKINKSNIINPFKGYDQNLFYDYLYKKIRFEYNPGTTSWYSHFGTALLGITLCKIEQKPFEQLLIDRILAPLSMSSTSTKREKVREKLVQGLNAKGEPMPNWDFNIFTSAGGMLSSVSDLEHFLRAQFENPTNSTNLTHQITYKNEENVAIGLGWLYYLKDGKPLLFQNGSSGGYQSSMVLDKEAKTGVIVLANCSLINTKESAIFDDLAFELLKSL